MVLTHFESFGMRAVQMTWVGKVEKRPADDEIANNRGDIWWDETNLWMTKANILLILIF